MESMEKTMRSMQEEIHEGQKKIVKLETELKDHGVKYWVAVFLDSLYLCRL
jgi:hypothetical protein